MKIPSLRTYRWASLGLVVGLLIGGVRRWAGPAYDAGGVDTLDPAGFEQLVVEQGDYPRDRQLRQYHAGQPAVRALVVHPPDAGDAGACWVSGEAFAIVGHRATAGDLKSPLVPYGVWSPFKFRAPVPYRAVLSRPGPYSSVAGYLAALHGGPNPGLAFRLAWWERSPLDLLLPAAVGLVGIGVAWPLALRLVTGARPAGTGPVWLAAGAKATPPTPPDSSGRLADLNRTLEADLAGGATDDASGPRAVEGLSATAVAAIVVPPAEPSSEAPPDSPQARRAYGGEFYPVARPAAPPSDPDAPTLAERSGG